MYTNSNSLFWSSLVLKSGIWILIMVIVMVVCWYIIDLVVVRTGYANCRLKRYIRQESVASKSNLTGDLVLGKVSGASKKSLISVAVRNLDKNLDKDIDKKQSHQSTFKESNEMAVAQAGHPKILTILDNTKAQHHGVKNGTRGIREVSNKNGTIRIIRGGQSPIVTGQVVSNPKTLKPLVAPLENSLDHTNLVPRGNLNLVNDPTVGVLPAKGYGALDNMIYADKSAKPALPGIAQLPGGQPTGPDPKQQTTTVAAKDADMSDRLAIARLAADMSGFSLQNNPWIKSAIQGDSFDCRRVVNAPVEMDLSKVSTNHSDEICAWLCRKRFAANLGRYAGSFDKVQNTCACNIQDCKSAKTGTTQKRKVIETPTNGVNINNKSMAASMCPSVCLMQHIGKNAEALPSWDGIVRNSEGVEVGRKPGSCFCVVDDATDT